MKRFWLFFVVFAVLILSCKNSENHDLVIDECDYHSLLKHGFPLIDQYGEFRARGLSRSIGQTLYYRFPDTTEQVVVERITTVDSLGNDYFQRFTYKEGAFVPSKSHFAYGFVSGDSIEIHVFQEPEVEVIRLFEKDGFRIINSSGFKIHKNTEYGMLRFDAGFLDNPDQVLFFEYYVDLVLLLKKQELFTCLDEESYYTTKLLNQLVRNQ